MTVCVRLSGVVSVEFCDSKWLGDCDLAGVFVDTEWGSLLLFWLVFG